ncbi:Band 4-like protein [Schistosoma japonicum]|uniref:Band 4-like protein n=1 Tax=Schistosoma japonicum TaxID=6182 RepID=A0A4Z2DUY4_SCHJA|nr:Band 4.1-like protein 3 [Schistosoma japonicum]KAH8866854.1 Band 4.1-like protein 3 [Schistosoma japonicum]KAH8866855.1 Band 4.1-like protein 3 [Schistosoma japonicum]KAH8866856.1 Band 4.1-like protein 3 [Schistosoma japonicum]TNN20361.1 Band 4-like protein [Schistosoma japonicum]
MQNLHKHRREPSEKAYRKKKSQEYIHLPTNRLPSHVSGNRHESLTQEDDYHDPEPTEGYTDFSGSRRPHSSNRSAYKESVDNTYPHEKAERHRSKKKSQRHESVSNVLGMGHEYPDHYQESVHSYASDNENQHRSQAGSRISQNQVTYHRNEESEASGSIRYSGSLPPSPLSSSIPISNGRSQVHPESYISSHSNPHSDAYSGYEQDILDGEHPNGFVGNGGGFWNPEFGQGLHQTALQQNPHEASPTKNVLAKFFASFRRHKPRTHVSQITKPSDNYSSVRVIMLDGEELVFQLSRDDTGQALFDQVCQNLDLYEADYFGLTFISNKIRTWFWLELQTKIGKQLRDNEQGLFYFQVKFYPPEPSMLQEELTRYQLTLQIRQDIYTGKLPCSWITQALLGSFMVQAELGDFDRDKHIGLDYLHEFEFVPSPTPQLLKKIVELHKTHTGMKPNEADIKYLETAKRLELYGVDLHPARDTENVEIYIGVGFHGVVIYRDRLRIGRFAWPKVLRISYKKNNFYLKIRPDYSEPVEAIVGFRLLNPHLANRLWKAAVEHHSFFRLKETPAPKRPLSTPTLNKSQFRYTGRTFFQYRTTNIDRPHPQFNRSMLKRRTASMPTGLNGSLNMHTLNRAHPRDMTVGRTQNNELNGLRRTGSVQMGHYGGVINGDGATQLYGTVPRHHPLSESFVSEGQDVHSQMSRQYSEGVANSLSYGSVNESYNNEAPYHNDYVNYKYSRRTKPNEVLSVTSGSQSSDYPVIQHGQHDYKGRYTSEISNSSNEYRPNSPVYANAKSHRYKKHDESVTNIAQPRSSNHSYDQDARISNLSSSRKPPIGGVPVLGGVMLPNNNSNHEVEKSRRSDHLRPLDSPNVKRKQQYSLEENNEEQTVTLTEDDKFSHHNNQYRPNHKHRKPLQTDYSASSNQNKSKHFERSHRRQSGNVEGML